MEEKEHNKIIYWIDDDINKIQSIMQGAVVKLWNLNGEGKKYKSKIIVFGNGFTMPEDNSLFDGKLKEQLNKKIKEQYREECEDIDGFEIKSTYRDNKWLIEGDVVDIPFMNESDSKVKDIYYEAYECWTKEDLGDEGKYNDASEKVKCIIEQMTIDSNAYVFIDIDLLFGDYIKVNDNKLVICMEFYKQLHDNNLECFFYSTNMIADDIEKRFLETFKAKYEYEDIIVYDRRFFIKKGLDYESLQDILNKR